MRNYNFQHSVAVGRARLLHVWYDRARLAWLPWPVGALVLFAVAYHGLVWLRS